jgi:hypothetical protein
MRRLEGHLECLDFGFSKTDNKLVIEALQYHIVSFLQNGAIQYGSYFILVSLLLFHRNRILGPLFLSKCWRQCPCRLLPHYNHERP